MEEKKSLNNKYQKIDIDETPEEVVEHVKEKPKKEKKAKTEKAQKPPKEKKVKEPKVKKEKAPKEPKLPKEKKVKEPKPPKVKKEKKKKWEVQIVEDYSAEISEEIAVPETPEVEEIKTETTEKTRRTEEIVLPATLEQMSEFGWELAEGNAYNSNSLVFSYETIDVTFTNADGVIISAWMYNSSRSSVTLSAFFSCSTSISNISLA